MKTFQKSIFMSIVLCCLAAITFSSCSDDDNGNTPLGLLISPSKMELAIGGSGSALVLGGRAPFTVTSDNSDVATAVLNGDTLIVTGLKAGKAVITVTDSLKISGHVSVNVTAPDSLEFSNDSVAVAAGTTDTITVDGGEAPFEAVSDDETIATVHVDGDTISITGIAAGTTSVAVTDKNGKNGKIAVAVE